MRAEFLPADALQNVRIALSVSSSPDLARLGLLETHFRLALAELARSILIMGGGLAYGGHLLPDGYTPFLIRELEKYGDVSRTLHVYLAWQEHRERSVSELTAIDLQLGISGSLICLDVDGNKVRHHERDEQPERISDPDTRKAALSAMRRMVSNNTEGRVLIGGKRHEFQGEMPGLLEEAMLTLDAGKALFLAGGFGGVTLDIARRLDARCDLICPPRSDARELDQRETTGLAQFDALLAGRGWEALCNGLSATENLRLAATHRPGEIAALVSLGLGRLQKPRDEAPTS